MLLSVGSLRAARRMQSAMLARVMRHPMSFFDTTPVGRVLNRFAKDVDCLDNVLPNTLRSMLVQLLSVHTRVFSLFQTKNGLPSSAVRFVPSTSPSGLVRLSTESATALYLVLPSFTGFYLVLLSFTGFYLVLPGFTGFYLVLHTFSYFYLVIQIFNRVLHTLT